MSADPVFDDLVIGTSPISLLEAVHLAGTGRSVCLVDRHPTLGGAWRVEDRLGLEAVEISPHLFVPDDVVHRILTDVFGTELETVRPEPTYRYWGDPRFDGDYPIRNQLGERVRDLVREARTSRRQRVLLPLDVAVEARGRWRHRTPVHYPRGGLVRLLDDVAGVLARSGVEVRLGTTVHCLDRRRADDRFVASTSTGPIRAARVALPRVIDLQGFGLDGRPVPVSTRDNHSTHVVIRTESASPRPLRFLKVTGSPFVELVNDVTPWCRGDLGPRDRVVAVRCARSLVVDPTDPERSVERVVEHLRELDYLPAGDRLVAHHVTEACDRVLAHYMPARLTRLYGDAITFLGAAELDISGAIRRFNRERWHFVDDALRGRGREHG